MFKLRNLLILLCLLLVALPAMAQEELPYTVNLSDIDPYGPIMVGSNGMTLYNFSRDSVNTSVCVDRCAENWPALTVESADALTVDPAITGVFGTIERADGTLQVTWNGQPLYYWARDEAPGDTTGNDVGHVWWVMPPATVSVWQTADLGSYLIGPEGMTVYLFTNDEQGAGTSACSGDCLTNWPPVTVADAADLVKGVNLHGELGTITRDDGTLQVTYDGWPLYYFANDAAPGDTTGEGRGDVWWTIAPETVVISSSDLGDFLTAGAGGKTLYTFTHDTEGVSTCTGECADAWPAFIVGENQRLVGGAGVEGELATVAREEGDLQVTYNGMPLYYFAEDAAPGDTNGQGLGDVWFVAAP
jgi:predicted lipoprotein with Yx(FWY)xxD motif